MTEKLITDIAPVVVDKMDIGKLFSKRELLYLEQAYSYY